MDCRRQQWRAAIHPANPGNSPRRPVRAAEKLTCLNTAKSAANLLDQTTNFVLVFQQPAKSATRASTLGESNMRKQTLKDNLISRTRSRILSGTSPAALPSWMLPVAGIVTICLLFYLGHNHDVLIRVAIAL